MPNLDRAAVTLVQQHAAGGEARVRLAFDDPFRAEIGVPQVLASGDGFDLDGKRVASAGFRGFHVTDFTHDIGRFDP